MCATDPFLKLTLMNGGRAVQTEQTSVMHKTQNPYWNKEFMFDSTYIEARVLAFWRICLSDSTILSSTTEHTYS